MRLRTLVLIVITLLTINSPSSGGSNSDKKGSVSRFLAWCGRAIGLLGGAKDLSRDRSRAQSLRPITPENIGEILESELPWLGELSPAEWVAVREAIDLSGSAESVLIFLGAYNGPRDRLEQALNWNVARLRDCATAPSHSYPAETWLSLPGFEPVKEAWRRYQTQGWSAVLEPSRLETNQDARVEPANKEIVFRNSLNGEPKFLTVAEEIFHIESLQDTALNRPLVEGWIRELLGEVLYEKDLSQVDRTTRYHWAFLFQHRQKLEAIPEMEVQRVLVFLIERDAMLRNLELYKELVKTRPEFRNLLWDSFAASEYPAEKMSSILNQQERFKLNPKLVEKLDRYTLDQIIHALGGETVKERDTRISRASNPPPPRPAFLSPTMKIDWQLISELDKADQEAGTAHAVEAGLYAIEANLYPDTLYWVARAVGKAALPGVNGQPPRDPSAVTKFVEVLVDCPAFRKFTRDTNSSGDIITILAAAQELEPQYRPDSRKVERIVLGFLQVHGTPGLAGRETGCDALHLHLATSVAKAAAAYFSKIADPSRAAQWNDTATRAEETLQRALRG